LGASPSPVMLHFLRSKILPRTAKAAPQLQASSARILRCLKCFHEPTRTHSRNRGTDARPRQSPAPGFGEKYWSLSGFLPHSLESGGGAFLTVIFGQIFAYSAFSDSHFSSPGSVSGLIASTGHSGSHTPQSMHSSGWMTSMFSPS